VKKKGKMKGDKKQNQKRRKDNKTLSQKKQKRGREKNLTVSGEGLPWNWMILLGHRRLQYIGEEPLGVAGG
jgi:hypothetical protein